MDLLYRKSYAGAASARNKWKATTVAQHTNRQLCMNICKYEDLRSQEQTPVPWTRVTSPKKVLKPFFFPAVFPYIWPLAGPNIEKKVGPLQKLARGDRQTHFGTFNFWIKRGKAAGRSAVKKKCVFLYLFYIFSNIWSLARPNIAGELSLIHI